MFNINGMTPTFSTIDKLLAVADSEKTLSCECDNVSRFDSLKLQLKKEIRKYE